MELGGRPLLEAPPQMRVLLRKSKCFACMLLHTTFCLNDVFRIMFCVRCVARIFAQFKKAHQCLAKFSDLVSEF